ncbi:hypothetical protein ACH47Z_39380 [Streptomyces sp. NPDC020192]|uniref:hypothetical protein n=1 Tax=Streptomyces sp. NPDC020192 TaxID=3365066 RepID=UPI0037B7E54C
MKRAIVVRVVLPAERAPSTSVAINRSSAAALDASAGEKSIGSLRARVHMSALRGCLQNEPADHFRTGHERQVTCIDTQFDKAKSGITTAQVGARSNSS